MSAHEYLTRRLARAQKRAVALGVLAWVTIYAAFLACVYFALRGQS
jgi:hypothetical protein